MFDDVKDIAGKLAPPSVISLGLSAMIFNTASQTQLDWPLIGKFVMDDALKAIMIAVVWFLIFTGWGLYRYFVPSFRHEVYCDIRSFRGWLQNDFNYLIGTEREWVEMRRELFSYSHTIPTKELKSIFNEIFQLCLNCEAYYMLRGHGQHTTQQALQYGNDVKLISNKISEFINKSEWVHRK